MTAENVQNGLTDQLTHTSIAEYGGNRRHAGNQEYDVAGDDLETGLQIQHAGQQQYQNTGHRDHILDVLGDKVRKEERRHDHQEYAEDDVLIPLRNGLLLLHLLHIFLLHGLLRNEAEGYDAVNEADNGRNGCCLEVIRDADGIFRRHALKEGIDGARHGCAHGYRNLGSPDGVQRTYGKQHSGRGKIAVLVQSLHEEQHDGQAGHLSHELGQHNRNGKHGQHDHDFLLALHALQYAAHFVDHAGTAQLCCHNDHRGHHDGGTAGKAGKGGFQIGHAGQNKKCAADHGRHAIGDLMRQQHNDHKGQYAKCDNNLRCHVSESPSLHWQAVCSPPVSPVYRLLLSPV